MAWWRSSRKRDSEDEALAESITETDDELECEIGGTAERAQARGSQPNAVPGPRAEARESPEVVMPVADVDDYPEDPFTGREHGLGAVPEPLAYGPEEEQISDVDRWHLIKQDLEEIDPDFISDLEEIALGRRDEPEPLGSERIVSALKNLDIRYLIDERGGIVALWERHIVQVRAEGPDSDILVLRARAYQTVPGDWAERGYAAMNEWNRTRRFLKAYLGEATDSGSLPVFGEIQVPVRPGITTALLEELIDCGTAISGTFVEWLEGELL